MRIKFLKPVILISILLLGLSVQAKECLIEEALKDPKLYENQAFWDDYAKLPSAEDPKAVAALLAKYTAQTSSKPGATIVDVTRNTTASRSTKSLKLSISHKAEKEIAKLQRGLGEKVDEFIDIVSKPNGIKEIRANPGRWNLEKLINVNHYTVRLSRDQRIMFEMNGDNLRILRVNREQIHEHQGQ